MTSVTITLFADQLVHYIVICNSNLVYKSTLILYLHCQAVPKHFTQIIQLKTETVDVLD